MNLYLLNLISKWAGIVVLTTISIFNFNVTTQETIINNNVIDKNSSIIGDVIEYDTEYSYDNSLPNTHKEVIQEGSNGVIYNTNETQLVVEPVDEVIEIGTGNKGLYSGTLTGYGPDCYGCSGLGNVSCYTKEKKKHSLITNGIYYNDDKYGNVRILAADHREFPCGTIIEITNSNLNKELGIVLDTGSAMRKAYENGSILIDLAFEKEAMSVSVTNRQTTFVVKRYGW